MRREEAVAWPGSRTLSIAAARLGGGDLPPFRVPGTTRHDYVLGALFDKRQVPLFVVNSLARDPVDRRLCSMCGESHYGKINELSDLPQISRFKRILRHVFRQAMPAPHRPRAAVPGGGARGHRL